jgi:dihydroorotase
VNPSFLIRGAQVVRPEGLNQEEVWVKDGLIAACGQKLNVPPGTEILKADGLLLFPGVIDPQVHFRDPGLTWKEDLHTGSCAAAAGGVTAFLDMPNTKPAITSHAALKEKLAHAATQCVVDFGFFIGATPDNLSELNSSPEACGIKIFMGSSTGDLLVHREADIERIFANGKKLIAVHAEDEAMIKAAAEALASSTDIQDHTRMRPPEAALKATQFAVGLAKKYRRRLHVLHLTTQEEAEFLALEGEKGLISTEVCPQHFLFSSPSVYEKLGTYGKMNPPIREARHGEALWKALVAGVIECMATDHAPHTHEEKALGFPKAPSGMPGVETLFPAMLDRASQGLCTYADLAKWMCEGPARLYAMVGKGRIAPGMDADLTLVDPKAEKKVENGKLQTKVNWSPFNGMTLRGWPVSTWVRGHRVFHEGQVDTTHRGRALRYDPAWEA